MNKQLIVAAVGALMLPLSFVAKADVMGGTDFTIYGRVVASLDRADTDKEGESATWDLGATQAGSRNQQSRFGLKADRDIGNGMNVGFKLEQGFDAGGGLNGSRHRYVYISGGFGKLTLGNDGSPYDSTGYDGSYFHGGKFRGTGRRDGIHYSNSMGAFSFSATLVGLSGNPATTPLARIADTDPTMSGDQEETDAAYIARLTADGVPGSGGDDLIRASNPDASGSTAYTPETPAERVTRLVAANVAATEANKRVADEDIDRTILGASYDFGAFRLIAAYDGDNTETDRDYTAISVKGDYGNLGYLFGYETQDDATKNGENDHTAYGMFLAYTASENDKVYMEYEVRDDDDLVAGGNEDATNTLVGYERKFGGGAVFVAEYHTQDFDAKDAADPSRLTLAMIVNF